MELKQLLTKVTDKGITIKSLSIMADINPHTLYAFTKGATKNLSKENAEKLYKVLMQLDSIEC